MKEYTERIKHNKDTTIFAKDLGKTIWLQNVQISLFNSLLTEYMEGQDIHSGSRKNYSVTTREKFCKEYLERLKPHQRKFYEVIPENVPVRLFLDLEYYTNENKVFFKNKNSLLLLLFRNLMEKN